MASNNELMYKRWITRFDYENLEYYPFALWVPSHLKNHPDLRLSYYVCLGDCIHLNNLMIEICSIL